ncbi:hypothetical protein P389DRAFT_201171 [Cystobasidium minutum MCA 4210]|uniref:uncharacterized protein n=1 Tax=Cystobasidium minutum MCA 4210 TaxID=1397322 RepID=UPI0034CE63A4|eukprot:jgi/Rhomi1/201171/MIX2000_2051_75
MNMDITYGEEVPLDAVAPLFANSKSSNSSASALSSYHGPLAPSSSSSSPPSTSSYNKQVDSTTVKASSSLPDDDEMEEGELLEEGEISEESSDESELIAATLIAPAYNPKKRKTDPVSASSLPLVTFPPLHHDLSLRIAPSYTSSSSPSSSFVASSAPALPVPSAPLQLSSRPQPTSSSSSSTLHKPYPPESTHDPGNINTDPERNNTIHEYEQLIDELYSYGVTCDYLIGRGVTKDLVVGTFAQKGYKLPEHHLSRHRERQQQWREHQASLVAQHQASTVLPIGQPQHHQFPPIQPQKEFKQTMPELQPHQRRHQDLAHSSTSISSSSVLVTSYLPPSQPISSSNPTSTVPAANGNTHHRATSILGDDSLIRMGRLLAPPPLSAPLSTTLPTKRQHGSQDLTLTTSHSPASVPATSNAAAAADKLTSDLQALKEELARKEAAAKEALRARKAALAKQNAQRAESFIEGLLSASLSVDGEDQATTDTSSSPPPPLSLLRQSDAVVESTSQGASQSTQDLEDYEEGEEVEITPPPEPIASSTLPASLPSSRPSHLRQGSFTTRFQSQFSRSSSRPVATDFESDPSHSLPNVPRWTEQLLESQRRSAETSEMLIDLSDSEDEDDVQYNDADYDELRQAVRDSKMQDAVASSAYNAYYQHENNAHPSSYSVHRALKIHESTTASSLSTNTAAPLKRHISPSATSSRASTPLVSTYRSATLASNSTSASTPVSSASKTELEAKQAEIRRMLEMIKKMESSKKNKKQKGKQTEPSAAANSTIAAKRATSTPLASAAVSRETSAAPASSQEANMAAKHNEEGSNKVIESIQAAKEKVGQLLDEQEQLVLAASTATTAPETGKEVGQHNFDVGSTATGGDGDAKVDGLLPSLPRTASQTASSSDEAMSISSEDE